MALPTKDSSFYNELEGIQYTEIPSPTYGVTVYQASNGTVWLAWGNGNWDQLAGAITHENVMAVVYAR